MAQEILKSVAEDWDSVYDLKETPLRAAIMIFYDKGENKFLLSRRSTINSVLPGEVVFPAEKGIDNFLDIAQRGIHEEMGRVEIVESVNLSIFSHGVGNLGQGQIQPIIITGWTGDITDINLTKESFFWVDRDQVMTSLTSVPSKLIFLMVLTELNLIKIEDFINAPKIKLPECLSR